MDDALAFFSAFDCLGRIESVLRNCKSIAQGVRVHRLQQVILDARGKQFAVQRDIVDVTERQHDGAGLAHLRKPANFAQRIVTAGKIDQQDLRRRRHRQRLHRIRQAAKIQLLGQVAHLDRDRLDGGDRLRIVEKSHEWLALRGAHGS
ncbi:hypothetical protein E6W36_15665 [Hankyongella ginsenosidimutans]|uniref:Uncharacterized protein n=1 Tax=Hankyongella ginsenosidimutans TaxID=1763828 RepID=A0A4D7C3U8_9SPHN|nr:hypothetical protein [Hankyongella ginsenosidimutans]QCI80434.1 hypothetical protein E6W36_15665 [Hankyongella ginsenosidimutans]